MKNEWSDAQKRCFSRLTAGMYRHRFKRCRFLTLTSTDLMSMSIDKAFNRLNQRIKMLTPMSLLSNGWLPYGKVVSYYGGSSWDRRMNFEYCKIRTSEGRQGVIHVVFFGDYIPLDWLRDAWKDLTATVEIVDIRQVRSSHVYNHGRLASYCINQYCAGQSEFVSYRCSHRWLFPGAWLYYSRLKNDCRDSAFPCFNPYGGEYYPVDYNKLRVVWFDFIDRFALSGEANPYGVVGWLGDKN